MGENQQAFGKLANHAFERALRAVVGRELAYLEENTAAAKVAIERKMV